MNAKPGRANILRGIFLICRGKAGGLTEIGSGPEAFLSSLAPMIAFPLVGCALMAMQGRVQDGMTDFLASLVAILAPPVLSFSLVKRWGREAGWYRFATAFNWCQWVLPVLGAALVILAGILVQAGLPLRPIVIVLCCLLLGYAFWLHWFLARHALALSVGRAILLVVIINMLTIALVAGPQLIAMAAGGSSPLPPG
ncbi:hypothetical protein ACELLULO517_08495 [Acidisoma cellulosilytica]|uniref:Uncharacterized protein n=1 Tax=Acidisoma cellulosilyticum TaxID=2802395 RepID=A0A963Z1S9_9PROT|nr:hypothetical protein [Acidisoma cellulosilyticum]MCB8880268.1 hypothetical protein [Acidisoma cellulosilyticum]